VGSGEGKTQAKLLLSVQGRGRKPRTRGNPQKKKPRIKSKQDNTREKRGPFEARRKAKCLANHIILKRPPRNNGVRRKQGGNLFTDKWVPGLEARTENQLDDDLRRWYAT